MSNQVATIEPRRSVTVDMATRYGMEAAPFEATLRATVVPKECTKEQFAAFLMVAKQYNLNPITKEIYAFPKQGGGIQPIVSVDGWANLINSNPQCDGFDFEDSLDDKGNIAAITCRIYRKDRKHPTTATEYMAECKRDTSTWRQWPRRMLRHKALIQAARYAFGFAGIVDPDEAERFTSAPSGHYTNAPGPRLVPPPAPSAAQSEAAQPEPEPISAETEAELDRETMRTIENGGAHVDELADWLSDRIAEAERVKSTAALDELDEQVCRELDEARRDELRARWNATYGTAKVALGSKRK